jgi:protein phosphatase
MQLRHAARTDVGKTREHNEDSYGVELGGERAAAGALFVVCDGVGGFASGEVASDIAVKTIITQFYGLDNTDPTAALTAAIETSNEIVFQQGGGKMATTGVVALFRDDAVIVANVGDCRAYLIRDGEPRQITRDHSFVAEQVRQGNMTEQQARESSYRNIITRAIGQRPDVEVDTFRQPVLKDDILVLCSDGLYGQVSADEITLAVSKVPLDDACTRLVKLANDRGGPDNITIVAVQVTELTFRSEAPTGTGQHAVQREPTPQTTNKLSVAKSATTTTERLDVVYGPSPAVERRKTDRRSYAAPLLQSPTRPNRLRSLVLYAVAALLLAAACAGAYYVSVLAPGDPLPQQPATAPPTLTPLFERTTTPPVPTPSFVSPSSSPTR